MPQNATTTVTDNKRTTPKTIRIGLGDKTTSRALEISHWFNCKRIFKISSPRRLSKQVSRLQVLLAEFEFPPVDGKHYRQPSNVQLVFPVHCVATQPKRAESLQFVATPTVAHVAFHQKRAPPQNSRDTDTIPTCHSHEKRGRNGLRNLCVELVVFGEAIGRFLAHTGPFAKPI